MCGVPIAALCAGNLWCANQDRLSPLRETRLPVSSSRGHWFPLTDNARQQFAMRVAPDQSILVFDSDTSGYWPLVRVRKWWTENPANEVIQVPAWGSADARHIDSVFVEAQPAVAGSSMYPGRTRICWRTAALNGGITMGWCGVNGLLLFMPAILQASDMSTCPGTRRPKRLPKVTAMRISLLSNLERRFAFTQSRIDG
jgi:hypothetical protein